MGVALRERCSSDLPALLDLLARTHAQEGYPVRAEAVSADWLASPQELGGWVALADGRVLGHVALHPPREPSLTLWSAGTGRRAQELVMIARLYTDRSVRGAGTALLEHASVQARALGRLPVLEVEDGSPARGFYLRRGWREVGSARQQWGHRTVESVAMVAPEP